MDAFCGRLTSTSSSGGSDDGKNCLGINGIARTEATNSANEIAIVNHLARIANVRKLRYIRKILPGSAVFVFLGGTRMAAPNRGVKMTATNQETRSAIVTPAKSENVYSPAELAANPTGMKPAIVTSVPASIAIAWCRYEKIAASIWLAPSASRVSVASVVVIASSTSKASAMMSAQSDIGCMSVWPSAMIG